MSPQTENVFSNQLLASKDFFDRSTRVLEEGDSQFRPNEGTMTAAQQVAHVAQTLDWFVQGVSRPEGFDLDFERQAKELAAVTSLAAALPEGPIMGGQPMSNIVWGMIEHTAHHRGALTVYSRLLGKVPPMPYGG